MDPRRFLAPQDPPDMIDLLRLDQENDKKVGVSGPFEFKIGG